MTEKEKRGFSMGDEKNIEYKIELWKKMMDMLIQIENRSSGSVNVAIIAGVIGSILGALINKTNAYSDIINLLYFVVPSVILMALLAFSFDAKSAAIVKGFIAGLEDSMNIELNEIVFQFSGYHTNLYAAKYFPSNRIISIVYGAIISIISVFCFVNIFSLDLSLEIKILYLLFYLCTITVVLHDVLTNSDQEKLHVHIIINLICVEVLKKNIA